MKMLKKWTTAAGSIVTHALLAQFLVVALFSAMPKIAAAATVSAGSYNGSLFCTFMCTQRFQQLYSASYFSGVEQIHEVSFFSPDNLGSGIWTGDSSWTMKLSTSKKVVAIQAAGTFGFGGLSQSFADNVGTDETFFATKRLTSNPANGELVTFQGSFNYDPSLGDLLVDIELVSGPTVRIGLKGASGGSDGMFNYVSNGLVAGIYSPNSNSMAIGPTCDQYGCGHLLTQFQVAASVPEPQTLALALLALGATVVARRRRPR